MSDVSLGMSLDFVGAIKAVASLRYVVLDPIANRRSKRYRTDAGLAMNEQSAFIAQHRFTEVFYDLIPNVNEIRINRFRACPGKPVFLPCPGPGSNYDVLTWSLEELPGVYFRLIADQSTPTKSATREFARFPDAQLVVALVALRLDHEPSHFEEFVGRRTPLFNSNPSPIQAAVWDIENDLKTEEIAAAEVDDALLDGQSISSTVHGDDFRRTASRRQRYLMLPVLALSKFKQFGAKVAHGSD